VEGEGAEPLIDDNGVKPIARCVTRKQRRAGCAEQLTTFVLRPQAAGARLCDWGAVGGWRMRRSGGRIGECEGWAMIAWRGDGCRWS
jgi:hypothetical protein